LESLSQQHIIDCDERNFGCGGGFQTFATSFLSHEGLITAKDYPYTGQEGKCNSKDVNKVES